ALEVDEKRSLETENGPCDVAERHEVATGANRSTLIDVRHRASVEKRRVTLNDLQPDARCSSQQRVRSQQHRRSDIGLRETWSGSGLVLPERQPLNLD